MLQVRNKEDFINKIRAIDECLKNARLSEIVIDKENTGVKYVIICDQTVPEQIQKKVWYEVRQMTPKSVERVSVKINKIVSNDELINNEITKYLTEKHPSVAVFLKPTDVRTMDVGDVVKYVIKFTEDGIEYAKRSGLLNKINDHLAHKFCADFVGQTELKPQEETINLLDEEVFLSELEKIEHRTIKVPEVTTIDDSYMGNLAVYIEDLTKGSAVICGRITEIREKETKTGKPMFIFGLDDTTGRTSGVYFTKKNTCDKIRCLKVGDGIIARVTVGEYNGKPSTTIEKINRCEFPDNFEKKERYKKSTPKDYKLIFPEPAVTIKVTSVFDDLEVPPSLQNKTFVVFDLETTGIDVMKNGITEIGAVKIINGKITEQFTTLVKPDYTISEEITKLTGITTEMVKDSPSISAVIPDFIKFIDGATLVAHNAEFDTKFIKRFAGAEDYEVANPVMDTMLIMREVLPQLKRNDLHTLADYFGIVFRHHRALSDAYATAESFIELMKLKDKRK
ncbi:MAG: hypothetical protein E7362_05225 [Clostridiales bacterium]|nr:hypothetical protein [Clostridiales bacterium]